MRYGVVVRTIARAAVRRLVGQLTRRSAHPLGDEGSARVLRRGGHDSGSGHDSGGGVAVASAAADGGGEQRTPGVGRRASSEELDTRHVYYLHVVAASGACSCRPRTN